MAYRIEDEETRDQEVQDRLDEIEVQTFSPEVVARNESTRNTGIESGDSAALNPYPQWVPIRDFGEVGLVTLAIFLNRVDSHIAKMTIIDDIDFAFSSAPGTNKMMEFILDATIDSTGGYTINLLNNILPAGITIDNTANARTVIRFTTTDGGTTYYAEDLTTGGGGGNGGPFLLTAGDTMLGPIAYDPKVDAVSTAGRVDITSSYMFSTGTSPGADEVFFFDGALFNGQVLTYQVTNTTVQIIKNAVLKNIVNIVGDGGTEVTVEIDDTSNLTTGNSVNIKDTDNFDKDNALITVLGNGTEFTYELGSTASTTPESSGTVQRGNIVMPDDQDLILDSDVSTLGVAIANFIFDPSILGTGWRLTSSTNGDVVGPSSSTDNAIPRFDGTTGKLIQDSPITILDSGTMNFNNEPIANLEALGFNDIGGVISVANDAAGFNFVTTSDRPFRFTPNTTNVLDIDDDGLTMLNNKSIDLDGEIGDEVLGGELQNVNFIRAILSPSVGHIQAFGESDGTDGDSSWAINIGTGDPDANPDPILPGTFQVSDVNGIKFRVSGAKAGTNSLTEVVDLSVSGTADLNGKIDPSVVGGELINVNFLRGVLDGSVGHIQAFGATTGIAGGSSWAVNIGQSGHFQVSDSNGIKFRVAGATAGNNSLTEVVALSIADSTLITEISPPSAPAAGKVLLFDNADDEILSVRKDTGFLHQVENIANLSDVANRAGHWVRLPIVDSETDIDTISIVLITSVAGTHDGAMCLFTNSLSPSDTPFLLINANSFWYYLEIDQTQITVLANPTGRRLADIPFTPVRTTPYTRTDSTGYLTAVWPGQFFPGIIALAANLNSAGTFWMRGEDGGTDNDIGTFKAQAGVSGNDEPGIVTGQFPIIGTVTVTNEILDELAGPDDGSCCIIADDFYCKLNGRWFGEDF